MKCLKTIAIAAAIASAAAWSPLCRGVEAPQRELQHDPFKRPHRPSAAASQKAAAEGHWTPDLRAVIYDRKQPLVNIDGQVFGLGDSVNGYRIIRVEEREAVLDGQGKQIRLKLDRTPSR